MTRSENLTLTDTVSLIAILSAASFVISGATHFMIFKRFYRFNYFAIASPSDIAIGGFVTFTTIGVLTLMAAVALLIFIAVVARLKSLSPMPGFMSAKWWFGVMTFCAVISTGFMWTQTLWGDQWPDLGTGLVVSRDSDVREECKGGDVGWAGSQAVVVVCQDGFRVLRDFEKVQMIPATAQYEADRHAAAVAEATR